MKYICSLILSVFLISLSFADQRIRVMDKDIKGKGIECEIKIKKKDGKLELVSYTDNHGYVQVDFNCNQLEIAVFVPKGDYYSIEERCPIKKSEIYLSSITYVTILISNGEKLFKMGDYGSSTLAFSEAAARLKKYNKKESVNVEVKAFKAAGKTFGVKNPTIFDPKQLKLVISPELGMAIKEYQIKNGLEKTGKLDFNTLRSTSNKDLPSMMFEPMKGNI